MKRVFLIVSALTLASISYCQKLNWESLPTPQKTPVLKVNLPNSVINIGQCGDSEGCSTDQSAVTTAVSDFINCMNKKMDILIDESAFEYDEIPATTNHPGIFCWGYAHHCCTQIVLNPTLVNKKQSALHKD